MNSKNAYFFINKCFSHNIITKQISATVSVTQQKPFLIVKHSITT